MANGDGGAPPPVWVRAATPSQAFWRGVLETPSTPALVLMATMLGFGALAEAAGLTLWQSMFTTLVIFALPGQVVLVDQVAAGATLFTATLAVMLTAIRLMPMTIVLVPLLKTKATPIWVLLLISHVVAVTAWIEAMRRLPRLPGHLRTAYFSGFSLTLISINIVATGIGFFISGAVPAFVAAGLIFLTPLYFVISLIQISKPAGDLMAVAMGAIIGPVAFIYVPGFDLLVSGLAGGSLAYFLRRWRPA